MTVNVIPEANIFTLASATVLRGKLHNIDVRHSWEPVCVHANLFVLFRQSTSLVIQAETMVIVTNLSLLSRICQRCVIMCGFRRLGKLCVFIRRDEWSSGFIWNVRVLPMSVWIMTYCCLDDIYLRVMRMFWI